MTKRKAQNSFLVLTTLGVYLGLLMVGGAAPQVLAHSATTRNFDIADEVEVKDEFDNKPDSVSDPCIYDDELSVSENLSRSYALSVLLALDEASTANIGSLEESIAAWTDNDFNRGHTSVFGPICGGFQTSLKSSTLADGEFNLTFRIDAKNAADPYTLMTFLQLGMESKRWRTDPSRVGRVLTHTSQFIENEQLYVVTRLPRAGLDALLAKDAK